MMHPVTVLVLDHLLLRVSDNVHDCIVLPQVSEPIAALAQPIVHLACIVALQYGTSEVPMLVLCLPLPTCYVDVNCPFLLRGPWPH